MRKCLLEPKFWEALKNNLLWLHCGACIASTIFGLLVAQADRPHQMGQHRKITDLYADGDLVCRCGSLIWKLVYDNPARRSSNRSVFSTRSLSGLGAAMRRNNVLTIRTVELTFS